MGLILLMVVMKIGLFVAVAVAVAAAAAVGSVQVKPGCEYKCGDLEIPYPFGVREGCYVDERFYIECDKTRDPPKAFLNGIESNIVVTNISINGELHIMQYVARDCYTPNGLPVDSNRPSLRVPMFNISHTKNKFTTIGCDTYAYIYGNLEENPYVSGCMSLCDNVQSVKNGSCSGSGCCQLEIPQGLWNMTLEVRSFKNHAHVPFNPCGYAFVTEQHNFTFSSTYINNFTQEMVPLVLDWALIQNNASKKKSNYVCGPNTNLNTSFSADGSVYRCYCSDGYQGNPYLSDQGCQNRDECKEGVHDCIHKCVDTDGSYTCKCPKGQKGDGKRSGNGCTRSSSVPIIIGIGVGFTVLVIGSSWLYLGYRKWKFIQRKEDFFKKNGGLMLQQHLSQWQSSTTDMVRIFTQEELEKATNKYDESAVVGKGGYGTVYKGGLEDGLVVAIKKSKLVDHSQTSQFINEVMVLSQINHRNVVRLVGCCLETQVPLLVYEFIDNGTLYDHIHDRTNHDSLSWEARLKIASETAGVISYLHSSASTPIIHRDIKPTNILLDHNYTAKVSDFGASKLVPLDQTQLSTMVQGTLGYLDPEYLLTSELTEKSDVYSFGIVLLELITGKKAVSFEGPEAERNLAMYVLCAMKENRVEEVVERGMATEGKLEQIKEVAKLAKECLRVRGEERPSMKEVAMELEGLRMMQVEHSWVNDKSSSNAEEMIYLLDGEVDSSQYVVGDSINVVGDSIRAQILSHIHDGR